MFGGVQAVAWTDVKQMGVIVAGVCAVVVALVLGLPREVSLGDALHIAGAAGRLKTLDFSFNLTEKYTVWSGDDRRAVPDAVVLRLRPEPGAALPDREVDRRGAQLADDERVRQDPAPGAHPAHRRARVRLLPVRAAARALQPGPPGRRWRRAPRAGEYQGNRAGVRRGVRAAATGRVSSSPPPNAPATPAASARRARRSCASDAR